MLHYESLQDPKTLEEYIETTYLSKALLTTPLLNKGTAFTLAERHELGLLGKLPVRVETIEEQLARCYHQYQSYESALQKNIFLAYLHDDNEILFFRLVSEHLEEMLPTIYTPIVGTAVKRFSQEFRKPRGLYISYAEREHMAEILNNRTHPNVKIIVATDGERVLGIGDQGVGALDISIAKLMVYTLCGGVNPYHTLPIVLDVGTDNEELLSDPMYLGWRHRRIRGQAYDDFIEQFVQLVRQTLPAVFLHWEDFGRDNARRVLERYRSTICSFNDDMQGTAVVTLAAILSGVARTQRPLRSHRFLIYGAGTAGLGIADQILNALRRQGVSEAEAYRSFWLFDRQGVLFQDDPNLLEAQIKYARPPSERGAYDQSDLKSLIETCLPTVLIGASANPGAFDEASVRALARHCHNPVILPLSNPNERAEAQAEDLVYWTDNRALIATGSPFPAVIYQNERVVIAQCNNALVFPGIGLGVMAAEAREVTDNMLWAACQTLSNYAVALDAQAGLLPSNLHAREIAKQIAQAVAEAAVEDKVALPLSPVLIEHNIKRLQWEARYRPFRVAKT